MALILAFTLLFSFSHIYGQKRLPEYPNIRRCAGVLDPEEINFASPVYSYKFVKGTYSDCTHVIGSVVVNNMVGDIDLSFLNSIVEIGGSLVIFNLKNVKLVSFQNLTVIHGYMPYIFLKKKYSLFITYNQMQNGKPGIINLGSLTSVIQHGIHVSENVGYCHLKSVNWTLFPEERSQEVSVRFEPCSANVTCASSCPAINGQRFCYGDKPNMCQFVPNCSRERCGTARCYRDSAGIGRCCNEECAGGCTAFSRSSCFACKNTLRGNECHEYCRKRSEINMPNASFGFMLVNLCVNKCPPRFLEDASNCVRQCTPGMTYFSSGSKKCLPCTPNLAACQVCHQKLLEAAFLAKKRKYLKSNSYVYNFKQRRLAFTTRSVFKALINCSTYDGDIVVNLLSSRPIMYKENNMSRENKDLEEHVRAEDFKNLENLEHLNGQLYLLLNDYPTIKDLKFLSKLKSITYSGKVGFFVMSPYLEYLGLSRLKKLNVEVAQIAVSPNLCYMENFKGRFGAAKIQMYNVKPEAACRTEGKVCDASCSAKGCWGPGRFMCF